MSSRIEDLELREEFQHYIETGESTPELDEVLPLPHYQACLMEVIRELSQGYREMIDAD